MAGAHLAQPERQRRPDREERPERPQRERRPRRRKVLPRIITLLVIVAVAAGIGFAYYKLWYIDTEQRSALIMVRDYRNRLKDPDSMVLRGDILFMWAMEDKINEDGFDTNVYCYFVASGDNSYGASVKSMPCYLNGVYFGDYNDIDPGYELPTTDEERIEHTEALRVQLHLSEWGLMGESVVDKSDVWDVYKAYTVDGAKIARRLGIEYSDS